MARKTTGFPQRSLRWKYAFDAHATARYATKDQLPDDSRFPEITCQDVGNSWNSESTAAKTQNAR